MFGLKTRPKTQSQLLRDDDFLLGDTKTVVTHIAGDYNVDFLPEGVVIKRIFPRKGVNKWVVHRWNESTEYYAPTLDAALQDFFRNHPALLAIYNTNVVQ